MNETQMEVIDLIINFLREHEKQLDSRVSELGILIENLRRGGAISLEPSPTARGDEGVRTLSVENIIECERMLLRLFPQINLYERKILAVLLYRNAPSGAREISMLTDVPRHKLYHVINRLTETGFVKETTKNISEIEKPELWDYWPESRRRKFLTNNLVGVKHWVALPDLILEKFKIIESDYMILARWMKKMVDLGREK